MKFGTFKPIQEARKLLFRESIGSHQISVELNEVGWIHIRQYKGVTGMFGNTKLYADISLTTEDARNLMKCLAEFVPEQEQEPSPQDSGDAGVSGGGE